METCNESNRLEREKYWINRVNCVNDKKLEYDRKKVSKKYYEKNKEKIKKYRDYRRSWGGEMRANTNNLLKIDVNLFLL